MLDRRRDRHGQFCRNPGACPPDAEIFVNGVVVAVKTVKNSRVAVGFVWAFVAIPRPGPAKDH